jgi:hypothetical protein
MKRRWPGLLMFRSKSTITSLRESLEASERWFIWAALNHAGPRWASGTWRSIPVTLSSILRTALQFDQPGHLPHAKLARRSYKRPDTSRKGRSAMDTAGSIGTPVSKLEKHWKAIQRETTSQVEWPVPTKEELMDGARIDPFKLVDFAGPIETHPTYRRRSFDTSEEW